MTTPRPGRVLISEPELRTRIGELGQQIARDYAGETPVLVGVLQGAFLFMADLVRAIPGDITTDFIGLASYAGGNRSSGQVRIVSDQTTKAEELLHAVNDAARAVGSRFAGFLTVTAYVAVTVISTSDKDLAQLVIPRLFEGKGPSDTVRVWCPGCATGEEVYSLAILLREQFDTFATEPKVQPYVLRSWEAEFPDLGVAKSAGGARVYRRADVEQVLRIKHLLLVDGLTLAGARRRLEEEGAPVAADAPAIDELIGQNARERLTAVKRGLQSILDLLASRVPNVDDFQLAPQAASPTPPRVRGLPPSRAKAPRSKPSRVASARRSL